MSPISYAHVTHILRFPFGVQRLSIYTPRREAPSCVGGWVGGDILPPSIFLIFTYDNKHHALVLKKYLKVARAF